eukprot:CAMPEP_0194065514 /NCGR_PEP_ID=MMETSP0009_2-20130614/85510_1 /TAXON_ID=210454 /ORGANISM="Grammatophora oceanica, Strain CCMP 410" /LENGTH=235 /DNA_ID=CAMNT_0038718369 /DNA_START=778 /DNA_END=1483 /DNA_ORIENTATION=-
MSEQPMSPSNTIVDDPTWSFGSDEVATAAASDAASLGDGNDSGEQSMGAVYTDGSSSPEPVFPSQDYIHLTNRACRARTERRINGMTGTGVRRGPIKDCHRRGHRKVRPEDRFRVGHYVGFRTRPSDLPCGCTDIESLSTQMASRRLGQLRVGDMIFERYVCSRPLETVRFGTKKGRDVGSAPRWMLRLFRLKESDLPNGRLDVASLSGLSMGNVAPKKLLEGDPNAQSLGGVST